LAQSGHLDCVEGCPKRRLKNHNAGYGYGSLACGADTLIVEALLQRKAEVEVVLPFEINSFRKESIANASL
jgi:hypothetical protein